MARPHPLCQHGAKAPTCLAWINRTLTNYFSLPKSYFIEDDHQPNEFTSTLEADPFANQLFAAYGEVKKEFTQDDIDDIKMFMEMVAERKRKKKEKEQSEK